MPLLFLLLVVTPLFELWLIFKVGSFIGFSATLLLIFLTAIVGAALLRRQGFSTLFRARQKMSEGQMPAQEMAEGLMLAFAGALMLTPGFATDTIGFLLLVPQVRRALIHRFKDKLSFSSAGMSGGYTQASSDSSYSQSEDSVIIEGEFRNESASGSYKAETDNEKLR